MSVQVDVKRLDALEKRIKEIFIDEMGFSCLPVEFDIVPATKMMEIMAYGGPVNISWWVYGRDYEKIRTRYENEGVHLPYEVVMYGNPARAFLINTNTVGQHILVMSHVYGHVAHYTVSKWFQTGRIDLMPILSQASKRFNEYERKYGIDVVEKTIDAAKAIYLHSNPFDTETEEERRQRVYEQTKLEYRPNLSEFADLFRGKDEKQVKEDIEAHNMKLWREIRQRVPAEPTEDLMRFIIDNSPELEDFQRDILEIIRIEGHSHWGHIRCKYVAEGFATWAHDKIINRLRDENLISEEEHGQYNFSNAIVKAEHPLAMNPYLIGYEMFRDIEDRWNKGKFGREYDECDNRNIRDAWDLKIGKGIEKIKEVIVSYNDWFFMQDFLSKEVIEKLRLYIYAVGRKGDEIRAVITDHEMEEIRQILVQLFAMPPIPKILAVDGRNKLVLEHSYYGTPLDLEYAKKTLKHIYELWGQTVILKTVIRDTKIEIHVTQEKINIVEVD